MVVSLATDKGVWDAVLANEKIKEFRRNFSAPTSEGTSVQSTTYTLSFNICRVPSPSLVRSVFLGKNSQASSPCFFQEFVLLK